MEVHILSFGQIASITGNNRLTWRDIADTDTLQTRLQERFPALKTASYIMAVDKKQIQGNTVLTNNMEVALLPPFSGG